MTLFKMVKIKKQSKYAIVNKKVSFKESEKNHNLLELLSETNKKRASFIVPKK